MATAKANNEDCERKRKQRVKHFRWHNHNNGILHSFFAVDVKLMVLDSAALQNKTITWQPN